MVLPVIFDAAGIRLGQLDSVQAINVFFTALIDPIKGIQYGEVIAKEAALPLGLPFLLLNGLLISIFLWENELDKVTISKYPLFKQLKEITTGTKEQVGLFSLLPVIRDVKIARFINPLFSPLEKYYNKEITYNQLSHKKAVNGVDWLSGYTMTSQYIIYPEIKLYGWII